MARETYEAWALRRLPRWLRGTALDKFSSIIFGQFDLVYQAARDAASATFITSAPADVVDKHGASRLLERLDSESTDAYRERIVAAWDFWSGVGTATGLQDALRLYIGCDELYLFAVQPNADDWTAGAAYSDEDSNADNWSRHAMAIGQPHSWVREAVGTGLVVGPDLMVGLSMTESELKRIRRIYRKHRPAHMCGIEMFILLDATDPIAVQLAHDAADPEVVRIALGPAPMVGYLSHGMMVGPTATLGAPIT